jgi:hypothetical protein
VLDAVAQHLRRLRGRSRTTVIRSVQTRFCANSESSIKDPITTPQLSAKRRSPLARADGSVLTAAHSGVVVLGELYPRSHRTREVVLDACCPRPTSQVHPWPPAILESRGGATARRGSSRSREIVELGRPHVVTAHRRTDRRRLQLRGRATRDLICRARVPPDSAGAARLEQERDVLPELSTMPSDHPHPRAISGDAQLPALPGPRGAADTDVFVATARHDRLHRRACAHPAEAPQRRVRTAGGPMLELTV